MSDVLPRGWAESELRECVMVLDNMRVPVNSNARAKRQGDIPYYGATGQVGWIDDFLFDEELLLIGEDGAPFFDKSKPIAYLIRGKSWVNNHAHVLRAKINTTSNLYLKHFLDWFDYHGYVNGTTRLKLTQGSMNQIPVRLAPLNEQRRIVAKLETLLGKVDTCQKRLGKIPVILKRFRQSILAAASSGRLSNDWRAGNNISDWVWGTLSQQNISIQTGPFGSSLHKADYKPNGIPIVNPMHIKDGKIITSREHCVSQSKAKELQKYRLISGDIVLGRRGEMGRAAVVKVPGYLCGTGSMFLKCNTDSLVPDFVCLLLRSPQAVMALQDASVGSTMINLNQHIVNELDFPIVTLKEQGEIVRRVEALFTFADQIEARYTKAKAHVDKITQSILAKTFRGELVLQNPKDEPASVLLGKLRLAREQPPTKQLRTNHQKAQKKITSKRKA